MDPVFVWLDILVKTVQLTFLFARPDFTISMEIVKFVCQDVNLVLVQKECIAHLVSILTITMEMDVPPVIQLVMGAQDHPLMNVVVAILDSIFN